MPWPSPNMVGVARSGFTLIELLVVVAIIAVLAGMLISGVTVVRTQAKRAQCSSNLRQLAVCITTYAHENEGGAVLVYDSVKQGTYLVVNYYNRNRSWGVLYSNGVIESPQVMFCPATSDTNSGNKYDTASNRWPHQSGANTRAGYAVRPEQFVADNTTFPAKLPQLGNYAAKAIAADLCSQPSHIDYSHVSGVNVAFGDGHVTWVPRTALAPSWLAIPANASWANTYDAGNAALWTGFDAQ